MPLPDPVRFSHLRTLGQLSPRHLFEAREMSTTISMEKGSAVHAMLSSAERVIGYDDVRRGKAWEAFKATYSDSLILTAAQFDAAKAMADAIRAHQWAAPLIDGVPEETLFWEYAGVRCRSTPDYYTADRIVEIKTTRTSKPGWFDSIALKSAYHGQLAFYSEALRTTGKANPKEHWIVAVENTHPYVVTVYKLTDRCVAIGDRLWRSWMERFKVCLDCNIWNGYAPAPVDLDVDDETAAALEDGSDDDAAEPPDAA